MAEHRLALTINGRERLLEKRLVPFSMPAGRRPAGTGHAQWGSVAIVGLGYVGLPTALALLGRASRITGFDVSDDRLRAIEAGDVDLSDLDPTPLIEQARQSIHARPARVVERAAEVLAADGRPLAGVKVIVVGVSYKAGVSDVRESPALAIIDGFTERGADVQYHDPLVPVIRTPQGRLRRSVAAPSGADFDLAVIHVLHPKTGDNCAGNDWIGGCRGFSTRRTSSTALRTAAWCEGCDDLSSARPKSDS